MSRFADFGTVGIVWVISQVCCLCVRSVVSVSLVCLFLLFSLVIGEAGCQEQKVGPNWWSLKIPIRPSYGDAGETNPSQNRQFKGEFRGRRRKRKVGNFRRLNVILLLLFGGGGIGLVCHLRYLILGVPCWWRQRSSDPETKPKFMWILARLATS